MTRMPSSGNRFEGLSGNKMELVRRLLAERSMDAKRIRTVPRAEGGAESRLPTSWAQQRLWFIDQLQGDHSAYHIAVGIRMKGGLDGRALQDALDALVERHEALRTSFTSVDGEPLQCIAPHCIFPLETVDLTSLRAAERAEQVQVHKADELHRAFDLSTCPLIRGRLLRLADDDHLLLVTMHHIISDGWSLGVFYSELGQLYSVYCTGQASPLASLPVQYADYAQWQREQLQGSALGKQLAYWRERLKGSAPQLELPTDLARPAVPSFRGASVPVVLDAQLRNEVLALAQRHQATLFMTLYAAWAALLFRLSGQQDLSIGIPVANRQRPELEGLIGFFVNTLVLRVQVRAEMRVDELLEQVKQVTLGAYDNQDVPFEKVVDALQPERSLSRNPLFQVAMVLQNAPAEAPAMHALATSLEEPLEEAAMFDLTLSLEERGEQIIGSLCYAVDLFDRQTAERWASCFEALLRSMTANGMARLGDLPILSSRERRRILEEFNATQSDCRQDTPIHQLFEEQAERAPDTIAVICDGKSLSYREINERANRLARHLLRQGVQVAERIPVLMSRSSDALVVQLGILKAGCAYVPIDPTQPIERQLFMIRDCGARWVLAHGPQLESLTHDELCWIDYRELEEALTTLSGTNLYLQLDAETPAYVMYTSGSTGAPKGVVVPHRAISRLAIQNRYAHIESTDRIAHCSNPAFDAATFEIWAAWLNGACIVVVPQPVLLDAERFAGLLEEQQVSILLMTAGLFTQYARVLLRVLPRMRYVMVGGDVIDPAVARRVLRHGAPGKFLNVYGPTECTTLVTAYPIESLHEQAVTVPIGKPIANTQIYILDGQLRPVPIGVSGEIYIGGAGVALGYLNRPELTAERFVKDPFGGDERQRLYRSGDLGRWRADGTIEFLGRNDHQVKIRGFRIEPGEIEARLLEQDEVREAVVVAREDQPGAKRLVAYVVWQEGAEGNIESVRAQLKAVLPEYMVPSAFVTLASMPLTPSGKIDRKALPAPEIGAYASREYEAPQGEVEEALSEIWRDLLRLERVGRRDNFFELGGHSLLIVQMMERLRRNGLSTSVRDIYDSASLADLASTLSRREVASSEVPPNLIPARCERITPQMLPLIELEPEHIERIVRAVPGGAANVQDIYPLAPLQEGMLFHHLLNEHGADAYARSLLLALDSRERLASVIAGLQRAIDRHDVLRTAVLWEQLPQPVQVVYRRAALPMQEIALDAHRDPVEQLEERMGSRQHRLDLRRAPLLRLEAARHPSGVHWYVILQTHHLVFDNESLHSLLADVTEGGSRAVERAFPASAGSASYRNYVAQSLAYARRHDAEHFFRRKLADVEESTAPFGVLDVHGDGSRIASARLALDADLAKRLRVQARNKAVSTAALFHAAWGLVLARTCARDDVVFGSVLLGRFQEGARDQGLLGMFMNTLPLRLKLQDLTAAALVRQANAELAELLTHQQASLALAQRCSGVDASVPLFTTLLNYLHASVEAAELGRAPGVKLLAGRGGTNYPIVLTVHDEAEGFTLKIDSDQRIDAGRMIEYVRTALQCLVHALECDSRQPVQSLSCLPESERRRVLEIFNATQASYPREELLHELFEAQVEQTPEALALVCRNRKLTYAELNRCANRLARHLRARGVRPRDRVAICMSRSAEIVIGMLGILKCGAAYVPLDPSHPQDRLAFLLADASPVVVITQPALLERLPPTSSAVVLLDASSPAITQDDDRNVAAGVAAEDLAYLMYTSGSTGQPKGVMVRHRNVINYATYACAQFDVAHGGGALIGTSMSFDLALTGLYPPLICGRAVRICAEDEDVSQAILEGRGYAPVKLTPTHLSVLSLPENEIEGRIHALVLGGEPLQGSALQWWHRHAPGTRIFNHYGPTEATIGCVVNEVRHEVDGPVPIGRPIANTRIYILDSHRMPVPVGVAGEIFIGGDAVAAGYWNRPTLTAERFLADPFSSDSGARIYRTGDVGRWRDDGTIEYLGRSDDQVKIRGFRIEPGEICAQLLTHPDVREAAVVPLEDKPGDKRLVAYVTAQPGTLASDRRLREYLRSTLPDYMIPSAFVVLDSLPLTLNGKLDKRALPIPEAAASTSTWEAPLGATERVLAEIWSELLGVERIGRHDNFFELGGHSLLGMRMVTQIAQRSGVKLSVITVFQHPTILSLAQLVDAQSGEHSASPMQQGEEFETGTL